MSKKKFIAGLESLFGDFGNESFREESILLKEKKTAKSRPKGKDSKNRSSRKNFTAHLDALLEEALSNPTEESPSQDHSKIKTNLRIAQVQKRNASLPTGLDALIRNTRGMSPDNYEISLKKRLTFIYDQEKIKKLKSIAKTEKTYLKDILGNVISEFIDRYEQTNGTIKSE